MIDKRKFLMAGGSLLLASGATALLAGCGDKKAVAGAAPVALGRGAGGCAAR